MDLYSILSFIAGLSFFLYGMHLMSTWLKRIGGGRMERILESATGNKVKGVAFGAGVTAVIQSSSATTVIIVGLVNSGVLALGQAVNVIMGANVGTTATAWILSLTGVEGDSIFVSMLKPSNFAPILALIGVALLLFTKKDKKKSIGGIFVGFAILMIGMDMMSDAMKPLTNSAEFTSLLTMFSSPIMGVLVGVLVTAVIQSSSASVGILQAFTLTGAVTYSMAIPIIFGQNIGTCVTALISCIGANKNAKRAAFVHLYFNLIGTIIFLVLFYVADGIFRFSFMNMPVNPADIAIVHTVFNVAATFLLLPFSEKLKKLACLTIRGDDVSGEAPILDPRLLNEPAFGLEQCRNLSKKMAELGRSMVLDTISNLKSYNVKVDANVVDSEKLLDHYDDELSNFLVKLSGKDFSDADGKEVGKLMLLIDDFERIGDHAMSISDATRDMYVGKHEFSEACREEMEVMYSATTRILDLMIDAYEGGDIQTAHMIEPLEDVIDALRLELKNRHILRLKEGVCTPELGYIYMDMLSHFERIADHCSNIALCLIQLREDKYGVHEYISTVKHTGGNEYHTLYKGFSSEYGLPSTKQISIEG